LLIAYPNKRMNDSTRSTPQQATTRTH
jgi:hypothetical protein